MFLLPIQLQERASKAIEELKGSLSKLDITHKTYLQKAKVSNSVSSMLICTNLYFLLLLDQEFDQSLVAFEKAVANPKTKPKDLPKVIIMALILLRLSIVNNFQQTILFRCLSQYLIYLLLFILFNLITIRLQFSSSMNKREIKLMKLSSFGRLII